MSTLSQQNPNTENGAHSDQEPKAAPAPPNGAAQAKGALCPYCGNVSTDMTRCTHCNGKFEPLSRQATQNAMGPWQIKDPKNPFLPGCSYERLRKAVETGRVTRSTVVRGPTTRQFWSFACNAPGVAVLLGECHSCHASVKTDAYMCGKCGVLLSPATDRQSLGLSPVTLLPGEAPADVVASTSLGSPNRPDVPQPLKASAVQQAGSVEASQSAEAKPAAPRRAPLQPEQAAQVQAVRERVAQMERHNEIEVRRLRGKVTGARVLAGAFVLSTIALAVTLVVMVTQPIDDSAAQREEQAAVVPERVAEPVAQEADPAPAVNENGFDLRLAQWQSNIDAALASAEGGDLEAVEAALQDLRSIQIEAESAHEGATFPILEERMDALKARVDSLRLRQMLDEE